ncbi:hypothetical protein JCM11672_07870 [Alkaliphilus crotonatoxidans]
MGYGHDAGCIYVDPIEECAILKAFKKGLFCTEINLHTIRRIFYYVSYSIVNTISGKSLTKTAQVFLTSK